MSQKLKDLREKRSKILHDADALIQGDNVTAELVQRARDMVASTDVLDSLIEREERSAKAEAEQREIPPTPRPNPGAGSGEISAEERKAKTAEATRQWMAYGRADDEHRSFIQGVEKRDLTTGNAGAVIPQQFYPELIVAQKLYGPIASLVAQRKTNNNGAPTKIALVNDTGNSLITVGENTTVPSNADPAFTSVIVSSDIITTTIVKVTLAELEDSNFDLQSWFRDAFGERFGRGMEQYVTNGNSGNVASLLSASHNSAATPAPVTGPVWKDLSALYGQLEPAYLPGAKFFMNSATRAVLIGETNSLGDPLLNKDTSGNPFSSLLGHDIVFNQALPNLGASVVGAIQFGDAAKAYLLRTDGDMKIIRFSELYMANLEVGFMGVIRAGGVSLDAGTHPMINLVQAAS